MARIKQSDLSCTVWSLIALIVLYAVNWPTLVESCYPCHIYVFAFLSFNAGVSAVLLRPIELVCIRCCQFLREE